jgi:outer membrane protein assembly factor BamB
MRKAAIGAFATAALLAPAAARAWMVPLPTSVAAMVTDAAGDVLVANQVSRRLTAASHIVKLDRRTGARIWRHRIGVAGRPWGVALVGVLAPIAGTDVVAGGEVKSPTESGALIARLAGQDGTERWRRLLRGGAAAPARERVTAAAVDAAGDVLVGGTLQSTDIPGDYGSFAVVKLRGADGGDLWRFRLPWPPSADVLAVDARGDAIAAGRKSGSPFYPALDPAAVVVVKLASETGRLLWRSDLDTAWDTKSIAIDAAGDVYLAVRTSGTDTADFGVVKLAGSTGEPIWFARESATDGTQEEALQVLLDSTGAVFAAGITRDLARPPGSTPVFTVVRLDAATGTRVWSYRAPAKRGSAARALALDPAGTLIATGYTSGAATCADGVAVGLDAATGTRRWSRTVDGTFATRNCFGGCEMGSCWVADNDQITALAIDPAGRPIVAGVWVNQGDSHTGSGFVRRLRSRP